PQQSSTGGGRATPEGLPAGPGRRLRRYGDNRPASPGGAFGKGASLCRCCLTFKSSAEAGLLQHAAHYLGRLQMLLRNGSGGPSVSLVVQIQAPEALQVVVNIREAKYSLTSRQPIAKAGILVQNRSPSRQEAGTAIAEPTASRGDVGVLGNTKVSA